MTRHLHRQVCELETAGLEAERPVRKEHCNWPGDFEALKEIGTGGDIDRRTLPEVERAQPCDMKAPPRLALLGKRVINTNHHTRDSLVHPSRRQS